MQIKEWASKLAEGDKGSYYNQEKWRKNDKASEKPIKTTAESVAFFLRPKQTNQRLSQSVKDSGNCTFLQKGQLC